MTGPLTLPGDPAASLQAATKHYVDLGLAAKADLTGGLVPAAELGAGTPSSSTCLQGNQTWGPCGTSSNAVQIQSSPVDTAAPADNQVITYVASTGKYEPRAGGGVTTWNAGGEVCGRFQLVADAGGGSEFAGSEDGESDGVPAGSDGDGAVVLRVHRGNGYAGGGAGDRRNVRRERIAGIVAVHDGQRDIPRDTRWGARRADCRRR